MNDFIEIKKDEQEVNLMPPLTWAYVGDCVYELYIRTKLVNETKLKPHALHIEAIKHVKAKAQAETLNKIYEELTEKEKDIAPFIQPCTEYYSKNVWDNCAIILSKRSDAELSPYLSDLFAWLQDMNWPGAFCILNRLQKYKNVDTFNSALDICLKKAKSSGEDVWWNNLQMLKKKHISQAMKR